MKKKNQVFRMAVLAMLLAVQLVLMFTPLGFIPIGPVRMTTMHIPVIIAGIVLGVKGGAAMGAVFGICSIIIGTISPTPTSFVFSPFYSVGAFSGNFNSVIIAMVPRILIGVFAALVYQQMKKMIRNQDAAVAASACVGSLTNTVLVMLGIYLFFGKSYAAATNISYDVLITAIMGIITTNGIVEAIGAVLIVMVVIRAIHPIIKKCSV